MKTVIRDVLTVVVIAAVIITGLQATVQKFGVVGPSMNYTLQTGQQLLVNKIVYRIHEPERGDVVIFHPPPEISDDIQIKRIIGLPGEKVQIEDGTVYIYKADGTKLTLDEPYVTNPATRPFLGEKIPENEYFVMGDNRINSSDSRTGWTLPQESIIGKAWLSLWPPKNWGVVSNHVSQEHEG